MHRTVLVALFVCLTACGVPNAPAGRTTDVDAVARAKVETWRRFYQQQDADGLRRFLADDFIVIDDEGTVSTKDAEVAWLAKNAWSGPADFLYVIDRISFPASDVALVVGHGFGTRVADGKEPCIETYRSSNVFQRIERDMEAGACPTSPARAACPALTTTRSTMASNDVAMTTPCIG